jgi:hypothetical protein
MFFFLSFSKNAGEYCKKLFEDLFSKVLLAKNFIDLYHLSKI